MTPPSGSYLPPPAPPAYSGGGSPPTPPNRSGRVFLAVLVALGLVGVAAAAGAAAFDDGPQWPDQWDPRVAEIVTFVEQHRGHEFKHPVRIYFLSDERYSDIAGGGPEQMEPTEEDRQYSRDSVAEYRALGLMEGDPDLLAANETLQDSGTLAFYSPDDDVVNVRGTTMTPGLRVTLVHELTHALQDQYFDLSPIGEAETADESGAARAVVEGDAVAVEEAYIETMSDADREEYEREATADGEDADADLGDVPAVLQVLFGSYYVVGNAFVNYWKAGPDGTPDPAGLDDVLRDLPAGSHQLFNPIDYHDRRTPVTVEAPTPGPGEEFETSTFGVGQLFIMLAERIDPTMALLATDGWLGDGYTASTVDGRMCVTGRVVLVDEQNADEFQAALSEWTLQMPTEAAASVGPAYEMDGRSAVTFTSCDPGPTADMRLTGNSGPALAFPVTRLQIAAEGLRAGRDRDSALCYADEVVRRLTIEDLQSDDRTPRIDDAVAAAETACP